MARKEGRQMERRMPGSRWQVEELRSDPENRWAGASRSWQVESHGAEWEAGSPDTLARHRRSAVGWQLMQVRP